MVRLLSFAAVAALLVFAADHVAAAERMPIDQYVSTFNPDFLDTQDKKHPSVPLQDAFEGSASDIAVEVKGNTWFSFLVFLPFLILPQILLLVAMFKFRARKNDSRKPATFMHHTSLENAWTAIPILTLIIVAFPIYPLLYKMELPPRNPDVLISITGKQFSWDYEYKREKIIIREDGYSKLQEPIVIAKDKIVSVSITSADVNHAWWIPAFGVKKDGIRGRFNNAWFTPNRTGKFKGQCAELCGQDHAKMLIFAIVVEPDQYDDWVKLQHHRADADKVFRALEPPTGQFSSEAFDAALAIYFDQDRTYERADAVRYWVASSYASLSRRPPTDMTPDTVLKRAADRRETLDGAIGKYKLADNGSGATDSLAVIESVTTSQVQE
jgi:cytochrome c oxidase subunit II